MNTSDSLTLLSLLVTTFSPVFLPLFDIPIIGISNPLYLDNNQSKTRTYSFIIGNYGIGSAEDTRVSISSPHNLINFSISPYLSIYLKQDNNTTYRDDIEFFEIETIPPNMEINISGFINASGKDAIINPIVFSNQTVGLIGVNGTVIGIFVLIFFIFVAVILSITIWFYWYEGKIASPSDEKDEKFLKIDHNLNIGAIKDIHDE
jgi:hypothetical protein